MKPCVECGTLHEFKVILVCENCFQAPEEFSPCSRCRGPRDREGESYCRPCHAAHMRETRPKHSELSDEARFKANCRSYSNNLLKRGHITQEPCRVCGSQDSQMHHPDYSDPRNVEWMCRNCHLDYHEKHGESAGTSTPGSGSSGT